MPDNQPDPKPIPQAPGGVFVANFPGTNTPMVQGTGVETVQKVAPAFKNQAPPWYTPPNTIWSTLGCAVPQYGRYLHTANEIIFDFVNVAGYSLFDTMWKFRDRTLLRYPSKDCLWQIHQLLVLSRDRLFAKTTLDNQSPLLPTKTAPAYKMWLVYPVPLYGNFGCPNQWLRLCTEMVLLMMSEAMQHSDNDYSYHVTKNFFTTVYGYIQYLLIDMASKFFGIARDVSQADNFRIPDAAWQAYDPTKFSVSVEATAPRPPVGLAPTDTDLESIRALPIENVVGFLAPWPDAELKVGSGGVWANSGSPGADAANNAGQGGSGTSTSATAFRRDGPP